MTWNKRSPRSTAPSSTKATAKRKKKPSSSYLKLEHLLEDAKDRGLIRSFTLPPMDTKKCGRFKVYKPTVDDIVFDSGLEARYYIYLIELMNRGIVDNFERQQSFTLQPGFTLGEKRIRAITYIADFVVTYRNGDVEVIDVKGRETPDFKLKKKLFMYVFRLPLFCVQYYNGEWRTLDDIKKLKRGT